MPFSKVHPQAGTGCRCTVPFTRPIRVDVDVTIGILQKAVAAVLFQFRDRLRLVGRLLALGWTHCLWIVRCRISSCCWSQLVQLPFHTFDPWACRIDSVIVIDLKSERFLNIICVLKDQLFILLELLPFYLMLAICALWNLACLSSTKCSTG